MRDIKFRAWNKEKKQMMPPSSIWKMNLYSCENTYDFKLMQYTGLKDKNGKEIYESDAIHCIGDTFPAVVVFDEKALCWSAQLYHHGVKNELMTLGRYIHSREKAVRSKIEVIGNIYQDSHLLNENPELLGTES